jgi:hypothetical protein
MRWKRRGSDTAPLPTMTAPQPVSLTCGERWERGKVKKVRNERWEGREAGKGQCCPPALPIPSLLFTSSPCNLLYSSSPVTCGPLHTHQLPGHGHRNHVAVPDHRDPEHLPSPRDEGPVSTAVIPERESACERGRE